MYAREKINNNNDYYYSSCGRRDTNHRCHAVAVPAVLVLVKRAFDSWLIGWLGSSLIGGLWG